MLERKAPSGSRSGGEARPWIRRDRVSIIRELLEAASGGSVSVTTLMYKANLNHRILNEFYIPFLVNRGLLKNEGGEKMYKITRKGRELLQHYWKLSEMLWGG